MTGDWQELRTTSVTSVPLVWPRILVATACLSICFVPQPSKGWTKSVVFLSGLVQLKGSRLERAKDPNSLFSCYMFPPRFDHALVNCSVCVCVYLWEKYLQLWLLLRWLTMLSGSGAISTEFFNVTKFDEQLGWLRRRVLIMWQKKIHRAL